MANTFLLVTSISRASARTNVADVAFCAAASTNARSGSQALRNVIVPTEEDANNGVCKKCGRGETTTTDLSLEAHFRNAFSAAQPEPRMTIFSGSSDDEDEDDEFVLLALDDDDEEEDV